MPLASLPLGMTYGSTVPGTQSANRKSPAPSGVVFSMGAGTPTADDGQPRRSVVASRLETIRVKPAAATSRGRVIPTHAEPRRWQCEASRMSGLWVNRSRNCPLHYDVAGSSADLISATRARLTRTWSHARIINRQFPPSRFRPSAC